jgi:hypothetical protein
MAGVAGSTAIPGASARMNEMIAYVRLYLRDFPELNRLTQGYEHSPRMIAWAIVDALDDWNATPPFIGTIGIENFPSKSLLCRGATIALLESVGLLQTRNQLNFSDGGISVSVSDKAPLIMSWLQMFKQSYEDKKTRFKSSANVEMAMDGAGTFSEYFIINGIYLE